MADVDFTMHAWPRNRATFPSKWILVCEDDGEWQEKFVAYLTKRFGGQGDVLFVMCPSGIFMPAAAAWANEPYCVLVDHDMPVGHGLDVVRVLKQGDYQGPICAISGLDQNNEGLLLAGATHVAKKGDWKALDEFFTEISDVDVG